MNVDGCNSLHPDVPHEIAALRECVRSLEECVRTLSAELKRQRAINEGQAMIIRNQRARL